MYRGAKCKLVRLFMRDPPATCISSRYMNGSTRRWETVWAGSLRLALTCSTLDSRQNRCLERSITENIYGNYPFFVTTECW